MKPFHKERNRLVERPLRWTGSGSWTCAALIQMLSGWMLCYGS
jgi:hypothetical protein